MLWLDTHPIHLTRLDVSKDTPQLGKQTWQELDLVAARHQNLEGDREPGHGLLIADALVGAQENIELAFGQGEPGRAGCFSRSLYGDVMTT
jgi:hypothetical protein